jgi:hypothetical protein
MKVPYNRLDTVKGYRFKAQQSRRQQPLRLLFFVARV